MKTLIMDLIKMLGTMIVGFIGVELVDLIVLTPIVYFLLLR